MIYIMGPVARHVHAYNSITVSSRPKVALEQEVASCESKSNAIIGVPLRWPGVPEINDYTAITRAGFKGGGADGPGPRPPTNRGPSYYPHSGSVTVETTASIPTKFCSTIETNLVFIVGWVSRGGAKSVIYNCPVFHLLHLCSLSSYIYSVAWLFITSPHKKAKYWDERVCYSVRLSLGSHVSKSRGQASPNFMRNVTVGGALCVVAMRYLLPILWMTSCFHIMGLNIDSNQILLIDKD